MAEDKDGRRPTSGLDYQAEVVEAERLIEHVSCGATSHEILPNLPEGTVEAVLRMRDELAAGEVSTKTELAFFAARAVLGRAAFPATIDSLNCHASGESAKLYRELRVAGLIVFVALVLSFLGFSLLSQSLRTVELLNAEIDKLSQEAPGFREAGNCDRLSGVNYQTNLRKEKILLAYGAAQATAVALAFPTLAISDWRRQLAIELYSEDLKPQTVNGKPQCRESPTQMAGGTADAAVGGENEAYQRRMRCWNVQHAPTAHVIAPPNVDCGMQEVEQTGRAVHWTYSSLVLPMLFATYGGLVAARRRALWRLHQRTLTADRARGYWLRVGIGAFFGGFLSHVLPTFVGDPLVAKLPPFAIAFLAGYKIEALLDMLDKVLNPEARRDAAAKPGAAS
ncbi:MAG: hypothetical protein JNK67_26085 [Alphaproteobacteria bacterium]|nr:hypothetical protein [Alphaproteobacteria bacterium]